MPDLSFDPGLGEERMSAEAGVLLESVTRRDVPHLVPEESAQVTHLLPERRRGRIGIVLGIEQQRMPALSAHIFMTSVAVRELLVGVRAEKTRQGVTNVGDGSILGQVVRPAAAVAAVALRLFEDVVIDVMAPEKARQFG
jgi:hypothetical protein